MLSLAKAGRLLVPPKTCQETNDLSVANEGFVSWFDEKESVAFHLCMVASDDTP